MASIAVPMPDVDLNLRFSDDPWAEEYTSALLSYVAGDEHSGLRRAQQAAQRARADGLALQELSALHHEALRRVLEQLGTSRQAIAMGVSSVAPGPVASGQQVAGILAAAGTVFSGVLASFEADHRELEDARAALRRQNEVLEDQAGRVAHGLYDETGQLLASLHLALQGMARELPAHRVNLDRTKALLYEMEEQLRRFASVLRPTILDHLGLLPAIEQLAQRFSSVTGIWVSVENSIDGRIPPALEVAFYRALEEALANVQQHARARHVQIRLARAEGEITCLIRDDGVGFAVAEFEEGSPEQQRLGLIGIQERIRHLGGVLTVDSGEGSGTEVRVTIPAAG